MGKASITKKYALSASGILCITDNDVFIENVETGEMISMATLLSDFGDKLMKLSISYDEGYQQEGGA